jgi:hypothetical protein
MKTHRANTLKSKPRNLENAESFHRFLEAAGFQSWTPYSNYTLQAQMHKSHKVRSRVFACIILNSWGLPVKSAFAKYGSHAMRFVDVAAELGIDEKHARKIVLDLVARGWVRIEDRRIYPESHPVIKDTPEEPEEIDAITEAAWEPYLRFNKPHIIELRMEAHSVWNEYRKQERAERPGFEALSLEDKKALVEQDKTVAKNTPVPPEESVVPASDSGGTVPAILTGFKKKKTSVSRVSGVEAPALHPESIDKPGSDTEEQGVSPSPAARVPDPKTPSRQAGSSEPLNSPAAATPPQYALVIEALNEFGVATGLATKTFLRKCWDFSPDATAVEIAKIVKFKGDEARRRKIKNPLGFILTYAPELCPEAIKKLRNRTTSRPSLGQTHDELIASAILLAEDPAWAPHPQRAEWVAQLARYAEDDPEAVERIRAAMEAKGEIS